MTYSYGPIGSTPDLFLSETIERVDFEPWSGLGKAISESVTFYNGDFSYEVGGGFDRPFSDEKMELGPRRFGWMDVAQNRQSLSRLECIADTVGYGWGGGMYDTKVAAGLVWDDCSKTWLGDVVTQTPILFSDDHGGCLVGPEFMLGGVAMGDPVATLHKLGLPSHACATSKPSSNRSRRSRSALGPEPSLLGVASLCLPANGSVYCRSDGVRVRSAAVTYLPHNASFHSMENTQRFYCGRSLHRCHWNFIGRYKNLFARIVRCRNN